MSLVPGRHKKVHSFYAVWQYIFRSMDHLNLRVVYRFGLVSVNILDLYALDDEFQSQCILMQLGTDGNSCRYTGLCAY